jgi:hypothetical protein
VSNTLGLQIAFPLGYTACLDPDEKLNREFNCKLRAVRITSCSENIRDINEHLISALRMCFCCVNS